MTYKWWRIEIFFKSLVCHLLFSLPPGILAQEGSSSLPSIGGGPVGPTPAPQNLATQIIQGNFAGKPELMFTTWKTASDTQVRTMWTPTQNTTIPITQKNKTLIPPATASMFQQSGGSFLRMRVQLYHPAGAILFPNNANLAGLLDNFLKACQTADGSQDSKKTGFNFLLYFAQFHLNILHELYEYLTGIYTTMILTHYGEYSDAYLKYVEEYRKEPDPASGIATWKTSPLQDYITKEDTYALNRKALIVDHLINIIEAQSNKAILARFPALPEHLATRAGMTMMKYDYGAKLDLLIDQQEIAFIDAIAPDLDTGQKQASSNVIRSMRTNYVNGFGTYFTLFQQYTGLLEQGSQGVDTFVSYAKTIQTELNKVSPKLTKQKERKEKIKELRSMQTINPPIFFYNDEAMRGIKLIPTIAQTLPKNSQKVPLPQKVVAEAKAGTRLPFANAPVAFYANDEQGVNQLFINIPTAQGMFSQKILPQPDWLNTSEGIIKMLRACLGDFSVLLDDEFKGEDILDACLVCIIAKATNKTAQAATCPDCSTYLNTLRNLISQAQTQPSNGLPNINGGGIQGPPGPPGPSGLPGGNP